MAPLKLARPEFGLLPGSPLELVVCQVRHDDRTLDAASALSIQEATGGSQGRFPRIEQVQLHTASLAVGPGPVIAGPPEVAHGWHLKSNDGNWTAAILPGHFSLETTNYTRWHEFYENFAELVRAIDSVAAPTMEQRIGLRYVDRLSGLSVTEPSGWARWIRPTVLGPPLHPVLGGGVLSTRQQVDLDLGDNRFCVLRHGTVTDLGAGPAEVSVYLLDFDVYRQEAQRFVVETLLAAAQEFHEQADALFQEVITPDLLEYLSRDNNV